MIYLHQYPAVWGLPSLSPFCTKVETYLRMVNLPYEIVIENNPRKGPKGKMPVIKDGHNIIPDSSFILEYLEKQYSISLDADLSAKQKALGYATQKMIEESLYFVLLYSRWIDPEGKKIINNEFRAFFPKWLSGVALKIIRRDLKKQAYYQGLGRHTRDEIYHIGKQNIAVLNELIGDNLFFYGDKPHTIDATVYAFLMTILNERFASPLCENLKGYHRLVVYCERMKNLFF